jgi:hypothetical protein
MIQPRGTSVGVTVATGGGALHGVVKSEGQAVPSAPVFLEGWDPNTRRRIGELRRVWTDASGSFRFGGLTPGTYRLLSTFDYNSPDEAQINMYTTRTIRVELSTDQDVELRVDGGQ